MVKTLFSIILTLLLTLGCCFFEQLYVRNECTELSEATLSFCHALQTDDDASPADFLAEWKQSQKRLHALVPHADVAKLDLFYADAVGYLRQGEASLALSSLYSAVYYLKNLPENYRFTFGNVF